MNTNQQVVENELFKGPALFVRAMLRGMGQVMFQESAWTGLFFMVGIFWGSYENGLGIVAWGALIGVFASTLAGMLVGQPKEEGDAGLWGFNGVLVGCAFPTFLGNTIMMWVALIFCSMLTTWVRTGFNNVMSPWKINSFTYPFVFTTALFLLAARWMQAIPPVSLGTPELTIAFSPSIHLTLGNLIVYWLKGISQVFLINSWVAGIFFLVGLYLCSKWAAIWAAVASAVSLLVILTMHGPAADISQGLYGFSAVLTGIALGCTFYKVNAKSALWALAGIIATVFVQAAMNSWMLTYGIPTLTGPFCLTTWLFLLPLYKFHDGEIDHSVWHLKKLNK